MSESSYRHAREAQQAAARANGALSQGPVTPEGKASSSQNALTHGLSASYAIVSPDQREEYSLLVTGLQSDINPLGALEAILFEHLVRAAWNLRRAAKLEAHLYTQSGLDPLLIHENPLAEKQVARLNRHRADSQRAFNRALKELKILQTNRLTRQETPQAIPPGAPILADARHFTKRTQPPRPSAENLMGGNELSSTTAPESRNSLPTSSSSCPSHPAPAPLP